MREDLPHRIAVVPFRTRLQLHRKTAQIPHSIANRRTRVGIRSQREVMARQAGAVTDRIVKREMRRRPCVLQDEVVPDDGGDTRGPAVFEGWVRICVDEVGERGRELGFGC